MNIKNLTLAFFIALILPNSLYFSIFAKRLPPKHSGPREFLGKGKPKNRSVSRIHEDFEGGFNAKITREAKLRKKSKDCGTWGPLFPIQEESLIDVIQRRLQRLKKAGRIPALQEVWKEKVKKGLETIKPLPGMTKAKQNRTWFFDPSIPVPEDIQDHIVGSFKAQTSLLHPSRIPTYASSFAPCLNLKQSHYPGEIFYKKGERFNPLSQFSLPAPLLFIDGRDKDQVAWALNQEGKIILTAGQPFELMDQHDRRMFVDQLGIMTKKLGIRSVPARITQDDLRIKGEEVAL
jgi:conjugal transfer pilus assembly protein TraW